VTSPHAEGVIGAHTDQLLVLTRRAAALLLSASAARAQTQHANAKMITISVTVVRSCSVAVPDRVGQPVGSESGGLLTVRCGRGVADAVAVGVSGEPGSIVHLARGEDLQVGLPITARALSGIFALADPPAGNRHLFVLTLNF
jgi:hypothetical protein